MSNPAYLDLHDAGELRARADRALGRLTACTLCSRRCGADRPAGIRRATCRIGAQATVAGWGAAQAEPCLAGAGEILFAGCNLRCLACSTWQASWDGAGTAMDAEALAGLLLDMQGRGHGVVMLSSPSHVPAQILDALWRAADRGFRARLAWQTGGYDCLETLALLAGVVDLYVADFKHGDPAAARLCLGVDDYPRVAAQAMAEMHRQVGGLRLDGQGRAMGGLLVRHLVLPNGLSGSESVFAALPAGTAVRVLDTYQPRHRAARAPKLNALPSADEVARVRSMALSAGLRLV
ncbi:MAG TPA: hypothetical protein VK196_04560 [Magnetospirillum sp.]|nr:hypothetical protein [Magnetospirillum sp.]